MTLICLRRCIEKDIRIFSTAKTGHVDFEETLLVLRSDALIVAHSGNGVANMPAGGHIRGIHLNRPELLSNLSLDTTKIGVGYLF